MPGAALNVGTPPIFPDQIIIFLICFVPQHLLLPHHIHFVSRHNQLETEVAPDQDNNQSWEILLFYCEPKRDMVGQDVIIKDEVFPQCWLLRMINNINITDSTLSSWPTCSTTRPIKVSQRKERFSLKNCQIAINNLSSPAND